MSKNVNEYTEVTRVEKDKPSQFKQDDEIPLEEADQEVFDKFIKNQVK